MGMPSASIMGGSMGMPAQQGAAEQERLQGSGWGEGMRGRGAGKEDRARQVGPCQCGGVERSNVCVGARQAGSKQYSACGRMRRMRTWHAHIGAVGGSRPLGHLLCKLILQA